MKILAAIALAGAPLGAATATEPVQVMVIGTYHFNNPGQDLHNPKADDVLKPQRQRELESIAAALAEFRPTKVMVERSRGLRTSWTRAMPLSLPRIWPRSETSACKSAIGPQLGSV